MLPLFLIRLTFFRQINFAGTSGNFLAHFPYKIVVPAWAAVDGVLPQFFIWIYNFYLDILTVIFCWILPDYSPSIGIRQSSVPTIFFIRRTYFIRIYFARFPAIYWRIFLTRLSSQHKQLSVECWVSKLFSFRLLSSKANESLLLRLLLFS